jgi:methyl-accepting chemotaxis protein
VLTISRLRILFSRWIASPLRQVSQRLHNLVVSEGTLAERLAATKVLPVESADEIGQLRASLNATVTLLRQREADVRRDVRQDEALQWNIGNFMNVAQQIAQGDLTKPVWPRSYGPSCPSSRSESSAVERGSRLLPLVDP